MAEQISKEMQQEIDEIVQNLFPEVDASGENPSLKDLALRILNNTRESSLSAEEIQFFLDSTPTTDSGGKLLQFRSRMNPPSEK